MAYSINRDNFALISSPVITGDLAISGNSSSWVSQEYTVNMPESNKLEAFQINTINIPSEDISKWAEYGIYAISENILDNSITFRCSTIPTQNLRFTVIQSATSCIGGVVGYGNVVTGYAGASVIIYIPDGVYWIKENAFKDNTNVVILRFPRYGLRIIDDNAFKGCTSLGFIAFYEPFAITAEQFAGCTSVTDVVFDVSDGTWTQSVDLTFTNQIADDRLDAIVDKLYDYSGGTMHTLKIGATNKARMSAAQITAAQVKNWTVI